MVRSKLLFAVAVVLGSSAVMLGTVPAARAADPPKCEPDKLAAKYPSLNVTAVKERGNPGLNMTREKELVKICEEAMKDASIEPRLDKKATSTEAAQYFQAGYEAVVFGPGLSAGRPVFLSR